MNVATMDPAAAAHAMSQAAQGFGPHTSWLNKPVPGVANILERMFNLAHSEWAREFLFFPNPSVDAGILTSPLNLQYKVAGQIKLDFKADRVGPYTNSYLDPTGADAADDDRLYCDWVIVPAFNFGQQGACYFMQKTMNGPVQDHNGAVRSALYRIITDDVTGEVLYVGDMPETDTLQVIHMTHLNGAYHQRSMCFFEGSVFRAALTADNGRMSIPHIAKALVMCIHTRETRMCKTCGAHPSLLCNCPVSLRLSEHPHDLRYYAHNARQHLGHFTGKQHVLYLHKGAVVKQKIEHTLHRTNTDTDCDTVHNLRTWAVRDRLGAVVQRAFGKHVQRSPISAAAVAAAMLNVENKSFDEVVDVLAEADSAVAHPFAPAGAIAAPPDMQWGAGAGYATNAAGEVDISGPVVPRGGYHVNGPIAVAAVAQGYTGSRSLSSEMHSVALLAQHQAQSRQREHANLVRQQLLLQQQQLRQQEMEQRRRLLQQQQQAAKQLAARQEMARQQQLAEQRQQQQLVQQRQQEQLVQQRMAQQQELERQQQAARQRELARQQHVAAQQQQQQLLELRRARELHTSAMMPAQVVARSARAAPNGAPLHQALGRGVGRAAAGCKESAGLGLLDMAGTRPQGGGGGGGTEMGDVAMVNGTSNVYFAKRPRADAGSAISTANYVPATPCALAAEQMRVPLAAPQHAGMPMAGAAGGAATFGAAMYAASGAFRTELGAAGTSPPTGASRALMPAGRPAIRPAPVERRLLPRGAQPAPQPPEDPKMKRELDMRIRKREAARRSDARRMARVQQLQNQTNEMERTAAQLRAKQAKLLDENAMLKRQVAALRTRVPTR